MTEARYTASDHEFREGDPYALAKYRITLRWLRAWPRDTVLFHIGCGSGIFNEMAVERGFLVRAFEPDPAAFALAAGRCRGDRCTVQMLALGDIAPKPSADVIVMHDVLEHIEDDSRAIDRLSRILKPGGALILSVPAMPSLFGFHDEQLGHFRRYTRQTLKAVLQQRFEIASMRSFGIGFIPVTIWYSRWRRIAYPTQAVGEGGFASRAVRSLSRIEERIRPPVGTSLVCEARLLAP